MSSIFRWSVAMIINILEVNLKIGNIYLRVGAKVAQRHIWDGAFIYADINVFR